jgi:hypothetical protein
MKASDDNEVVIAFSLTAEEGADRTAEFRALFAGTHVVTHREPRDLRLWFDNSPSMQKAQKELLAAESDCCPFVTHALVDESPRARLSLRVPSEAAEAWLDWFAGSVT